MLKASLPLIAAVGCLATTAGTTIAAEKIRFGPSQPATSIQTRPERTEIDLPPNAIPGIGNANASPSPAMRPPASGSVIIQTDQGEQDQSDWIFQDSQSAAGIQRALGVESYELDSPTPSLVNGPPTAMEEFYERRTQGRQSGISNGLDGLDGAQNFNRANSGFNAGLTGNGLGNLGQPNAPSPLVGIGSEPAGFQNTLNSENPAIRSYYRDIFRNRISPGSTPEMPALQSETPEFERRSQGDVSGDFFNQAALVNSLSQTDVSTLPTAGAAPNNPTPVIRPDRQNTIQPAPERRGGRTVIPSRPF